MLFHVHNNLIISQIYDYFGIITFNINDRYGIQNRVLCLSFILNVIIPKYNKCLLWDLDYFMTATKPPRGKHSIVRSDLTFAKGIFSSMEKCLLSIPSLNIEIFLPLTAILSNDI